MNKYAVIALLVIAVSVVSFSLINRSTPIPEPTSEQTPVLSNLEPNYTDPDYGYALYIPEGMTAEKQSEYSTLFYPADQPMGVGPTNFMYISVVPPQMRDNTGGIYNYSPDQFQKLIALENIGDSTNVVDGAVPELAQWYTYTVVAIEDMGTGKVKNFENTKPWEFPAGTTENRFIYGTNSNIYILGYYTGGRYRCDDRSAHSLSKHKKFQDKLK